MHLNIRVLCFCYLVVFVSSTTLQALNGTGHPNVSIVGGVPVRAGEFPYLARLVLDTQNGDQGSLCGGTLIGPYHVLTAAHCTSPNGMTVYLNTLSIHGGGCGSLTRTVKKYIEHENYIGTTVQMEYDMAILVLNSPVTTLRFAEMQPQSTTYANNLAVVAGWGATSFQGNPSPILLKTNVTIWDNKNCSAAYPKGKTIFVGSLMLCANAPPDKDTCQGDSGGMIIVDGVQVGITSYGKSCGMPISPGVYTRITALLKWIVSTIAKNPK